MTEILCRILLRNWLPIYTICCILYSQVLIFYKTRMIMGKFLCMAIAYLGSLSTPVYHLLVQVFVTGHSWLNNAVFKDLLATWLLIFWYFMPNVTFMIGTSISWFQVPVYIAEIAPQDQRGALGSVNQVVFFFNSERQQFHYCYSCVAFLLICQCCCQLRTNP